MDREDEIVQWWKDNPRKSLRDAEDHFEDEYDISYERIRQILANSDLDHKKYGGQGWDHYDPDNAVSKIKDFLRENQRIPKQYEWDETIRGDEDPPAKWIYQDYETWEKFVLDKVMPYHSHCRCRHFRYDDSYSEIISAILSLADELGRAPTYQEISDCPELPSWVGVYERFGRLSDLWESLGLEHKNSKQARVQEFTYSNNEIMDVLVWGYGQVGRDLRFTLFKNGRRLDESPIGYTTMSRRIAGCRYSLINLIERYKDFNDEIDWDQSKYFMYHFNGSDALNEDIYPEFVERQPETADEL